MKALITGDSHLSALLTGRKLLDAEREKPPVHVDLVPLGSGAAFCTPFFRDCGSHAEITEARYLQRVSRLPPEQPYDMIGLSGPMHTGRLWSRRLRRFAPWQLAPSRGLHALSDALLEQVIADDCMYVLGLLDVMRRTTGVFVIESPRPFREHEVVGLHGEQHVLTVDQAYRAYVRRELARRDIPLIEVPAECMEPDGFTKARFVRVAADGTKDNNHANARFGRIMMVRVEEFLQSASAT